MLTRTSLLIALAAARLSGQAPRSPHFTLGIRLPIGHTPAASSCDRVPFQRVENRKRTGNVVLWGGAAASAVGAYTLESGKTSGIPLIVGGLGAVIVGGYMKNSADDPDAVDQAVESFKVGETRAADVRACMGQPRTTTTRNSTEETWTYTMTRIHSTGGPAMYFVPIVGSMLASSSGAEIRTVTLTFKNGVLSDVSKTAGAF